MVSMLWIWILLLLLSSVRYLIDTIESPDDEHLNARNM